MDNEELTPKEKKMFGELPGDISPPASIEQRIITQLKSEGLIHGSSRNINPYLKWTAALAASLALFLAGSYFGKRSIAARQGKYNYVLLLQSPDTYTEGDPAERFREYSSWAGRIRESGLLITGEKLSDQSSIVSRDTVTVMVGREDFLSGFFMVQAGSAEDVITLAQESPHVKYGGAIEVRKIVRE